MTRAKNYEKLSKFVKVTAKILSVRFFSGHGVSYVRLMEWSVRMSSVVRVAYSED